MIEAHFDEHQFAGNGRLNHNERGHRKITHEDFKRMHYDVHVCHKEVPPFVLNQEQLTKVLCARAWRIVYGSKPFPPQFDFQELNRLATERALRGGNISPDAPPKQLKAAEDHKAAVRKAGGYMALIGAIVYRSWRLREDSVTISDALGVSPAAIRQQLWRFRETALSLGFDAGLRHPEKQIRVKNVDLQRVTALLETGLSCARVARLVGFGSFEYLRLKLRGAGYKPMCRRSASICREAPNKYGIDPFHAAHLLEAGRAWKGLVALYKTPGRNAIRYTMARAGLYKLAKQHPELFPVLFSQIKKGPHDNVNA